MDVGAFVQENRRWLIGCVSGCVVFLIASIVVRSVFAGSDTGSLLGLLKASSNAEVYPQAALEDARTEGEQLTAELQRLKAELAFVQDPRFQLAGKGDAAEYLFQVGRPLKQSILAAANERDVQVSDKDVGYPSVTGIEEIRAALFGLELLDEATKRLFAAHDAVRKQRPEAVGLRAIGQFRVEERKGPRMGQRGPARGEVDLRDLLVQERVSFQFQADAATATAFLEACRQPRRVLTLENVQMTQPQRIGDPVVVKGSLQGIAWKEQ